MTIPRFLRSPRLALALCLLIAAAAALGTVLPPARFFGAADVFASPMFAGLLLALAVNVAACTVHRGRSLRRHPSAGRVRFVVDALVHLSVLLVLAGGALKAARGSAATQYLFLDREVTTAREGGTGQEQPLGFGLLLKERVEEWYPLILQVGVSDARTGEKLALVVMREGREAAVPGRDLRLWISAADVESRRVTVQAASAGEDGGELQLDLVPEGTISGRIGDHGVHLLAWRRDLLRVRGRIAVLEGGREAGEHWLAPNERIAHRGASVFLTAWGEDQFQNPWLGIQVTRDPGAPLFWAGAVLFALAAPCLIALRWYPAPRQPAREGGDE